MPNTKLITKKNSRNSPFTKKFRLDEYSSNKTFEHFSNSIENSTAPLSSIEFTRSVDLNNNSLFIDKKYKLKTGPRSQLEPIDFDHFSLLVDCLRNSVSKWNSVTERCFSTIIYMLIRHFNSGYSEAKKVLEKLNCASIVTTHRWALTISETDEPCSILTDKRGGNQANTFYENFPEIEISARAFAIEETSKKNCEFSIQKLSQFITDQYKKLELKDHVELEEFQQIRSESSIRLDMAKWGAKWCKNTKKPYFIGHEREDVVQSRRKLVDFFIKNKHRFYQQSGDDEPEWVEPSEDDPMIILTHDECTSNAGEQQSSKWSFDFNAPFYDKSRGRSRMLSYFLCQHKYCGLFKLSEEEWENASNQYPELEEPGSCFDTDNHSANASMEPGKNRDGYFDNKAILEQFERLFKMIKFKTIFRNNKIVLLVDNARTHTAKKYDKNLLFKKSGTNCPYETLEWEENGEIKVFNFFDDENVSKGLFNACIELKLIDENSIPNDYSLEYLREVISNHKAFDQRSNLEILAEQYGIMILFWPKFHCELNPIESVWCFIKQFIRKRTDRTYDEMVRLIEEAKMQFSNNNLNAKLWRRFWQAINMYDQNLTYETIIKLLYGARTAENKAHRKIYNTLLN